jgi:hypothetical protein
MEAYIISTITCQIAMCCQIIVSTIRKRNPCLYIIYLYLSRTDPPKYPLFVVISEWAGLKRCSCSNTSIRRIDPFSLVYFVQLNNPLWSLMVCRQVALAVYLDTCTQFLDVYKVKTGKSSEFFVLSLLLINII